ncbi:MAG TPA: hypothetical protein VFN93_06785 [Gaiellaceae bacterium]|nr:hypothetical protein [Gaiellaceae bacterium]
MEEQVRHEEPREPLSLAHALVGAVVAALFATAVVVAAVLAFELNPAGPVVVDVAAIAVGSFAVRRVHDPALKAAAIGLVVGGLVSVLFWPFFPVDSPTLEPAARP